MLFIFISPVLAAIFGGGRKSWSLGIPERESLLHLDDEYTGGQNDER